MVLQSSGDLWQVFLYIIISLTYAFYVNETSLHICCLVTQTQGLVLLSAASLSGQFYSSITFYYFIIYAVHNYVVRNTDYEVLTVA